MGTELGQPRERPTIPIVDVGSDWPLATLDAELARAHALLDVGSRRFPQFAVQIADSISRRWLARWHPPYLAEIDRIAARIGRPGAYFLNVSYEWGCTSRAGQPAADAPPILMRVLDWPDPGLGRYVIAARVAGKQGRWLSMTWPGYTGVLQGVAPGRFAAALNQGPMETPVGIYALDWLANRGRVWRTPHLTAAHLLRRVFEEAATFAVAKRMLADTPVALPTIYTLAGIAPGETCVIERMPEAATVYDGAAAAAANAWQTPGWAGHARGDENAARREQMRKAAPSLDAAFPWLAPPVLNPMTRLVFVADAASGAFAAQGYEVDGPATNVLQGSV